MTLTTAVETPLGLPLNEMESNSISLMPSKSRWLAITEGEFSPT